MKKSLIYAICLLIMALMSFSTSTAQTRKGALIANSTTAEIHKYFSDNILLLDPIEGVWTMEGVAKSWNNYTTFPTQTDNYQIVIIKRGDGYYTDIAKEPTLKIKRIGETNVYDIDMHMNSEIWGNFWRSKKAVMENGFYFSFYYEDSYNDRYGTRFITTFNCVKEYPTASMYEEAIQREQEKQPSEWSGSGFALNNGYLCTNYHVVDEANTIRIFGAQGDFTTSYSAKVVASDKVNDLAILKVDDANFSGFGTIPYNVKTTMDEVGEDIFVLGYPLTATMGDEVKLTTGVISSRTGFQGDVSMYQISAPVQPGNSGGPLFDSKGDLVGIVSAKHTGAENVGYAVKASYLRNLMESSLSEDILPKNNTISSQPLTDKVSKVKNFVYYIVCSSKGYADQILQNFIEGQGENEDNPKPFEEYEIPEGMPIHIDVKDPHVDLSRKGITVKRVRVTDTHTIVDMECDRVVSNLASVGIDPKAFIRCDGRTYTLIDVINIPKVPEYYYFRDPDEKMSFTLFFPTIPKTTAEFDIIETGGNNPWKFYGISLNSPKSQSDNTVETSSYVEKEITNVTLDVGNPYIETSSKGLTIKRVRVTDTRTYVDIEFDNSFYGYDSIGVPPKTFLRDNKLIEYPLINTAGIPATPQKYYFADKNQKLQFTLIFPDIPKDVSKFDLIETGGQGLSFYGIDLNLNANVKIDVTNPYVRKSPYGLTIKRVRVTDEQTVVDFECDNSKSRYTSVRIYSSTYIVTNAGTELKLTKADGIHIAPKKHYLSYNEKLLFTLVFPALPENTTKFDLIEESGWKFLGIRLK